MHNLGWKHINALSPMHKGIECAMHISLCKFMAIKGDTG